MKYATFRRGFGRLCKYDAIFFSLHRGGRVKDRPVEEGQRRKNNNRIIIDDIIIIITEVLKYQIPVHIYRQYSTVRREFRSIQCVRFYTRSILAKSYQPTDQASLSSLSLRYYSTSRRDNIVLEPRKMTATTL